MSNTERKTLALLLAFLASLWIGCTAVRAESIGTVLDAALAEQQRNTETRITEVERQARAEIADVRSSAEGRIKAESDARLAADAIARSKIDALAEANAALAAKIAKLEAQLNPPATQPTTKPATTQPTTRPTLPQAIPATVNNAADLIRAVARSQPGEVIAIAPGEYRLPTTLVSPGAVTIRSADPSNRAILKPALSGIDLIQCKGIVSDLILDGDGVANVRGISFWSQNNQTVERVDIRGGLTSGIIDNYGVRNLTLRHNTIEGVDNGIYVAGHNPTVEWNTVKRIKTHAYRMESQTNGGGRIHGNWFEDAGGGIFICREWNMGAVVSTLEVSANTFKQINRGGGPGFDPEAYTTQTRVKEVLFKDNVMIGQGAQIRAGENILVTGNVGPWLNVFVREPAQKRDSRNITIQGNDFKKISFIFVDRAATAAEIAERQIVVIE